MWGVGPGMSEKAQICLTDEQADEKQTYVYVGA